MPDVQLVLLNRYRYLRPSPVTSTNLPEKSWKQDTYLARHAETKCHRASGGTERKQPFKTQDIVKANIMIIIILIGPFKMHDYRVTMGDRVRTDSPH